MADITGIGGIVQAASDIIGKFVPDADKRIEAQIELAKIADGAAERADEMLSSQIDVDKIEAQNPNLFVSGWRPFIGWVGGVSLAWTFILAPSIHVFIPKQPMPALDSSQLIPIILALLGIGTMRTVEKLGGVATAQAAPINNSDGGNIVTRTVGRWFH